MKQLNQIKDKLYTQINSRFQAGFVAKSRGVNSALSQYVNREINHLFNDMISGGHGAYVGQLSSLQTTLGLSWKPLAASTVARKGHSEFFRDSGELFANLQSTLPDKAVVRAFGGYSNKSVTATATNPKYQYVEKTNQLFDVRTGRLKKAGNAKFTLSFTVLNKLMQRKNPETLVDVLYRNSGLTPMSVKLGVYKNRQMYYHRNLIKPYARYYVKNVLPLKIKRWLKGKSK